jgi:hypothetical protein
MDIMRGSFYGRKISSLIINEMINDKVIYEKAKKEVYAMYKKPSAYRSGMLVKRYKELGGTYSGEKTKKGLVRWFKEEWKDVNPNKTKSSYPVFRPTKRITKETPLTASEIKKSNLVAQAKLKQIFKGDKNLKPFMKK